MSRNAVLNILDAECLVSNWIIKCFILKAFVASTKIVLKYFDSIQTCIWCPKSFFKCLDSVPNVHMMPRKKLSQKFWFNSNMHQCSKTVFHFKLDDQMIKRFVSSNISQKTVLSVSFQIEWSIMSKMLFWKF